MQCEMPIVGSVTRPMRVHERREIALCRNKTDAAYLSLRHCGLDQERIAERIPMDAGHLSRIIRGNRPWSDRLQATFERITGSFALTQWDCHVRGAEFFADPVETKKAQLRAELDQLERTDAPEADRQVRRA